MGLDLFCGDTSVRVGSYSTIREIRIFWLNSACLYLNKIMFNPSIYPGDKDNRKIKAEICLSHLKMRSKYLHKIYDVAEMNSLRYFGLTGLARWINHSDCPGYLSPGESLDIIETLKNIYPFMNEEYKNDYNHATSASFLFEKDTSDLCNYYLYDVFRESVDTLKNVDF